VIDGLRVGEIRKYPFRRLRDNIFQFRHSVPRQTGAPAGAALAPFAF
jgi:hypothetical protein